jgi:hypothetical protein
MVAALNIVASLILMVMEKHRDIAILKTMGASAKSITAIFMLQGVIIGVIGTAVGTVAGVAAATDRRPLPPGFGRGDIYMVSYMPFTVRPIDLLMVVSAAMIICFVATIYPSTPGGTPRPCASVEIRMTQRHSRNLERRTRVRWGRVGLLISWFRGSVRCSGQWRFSKRGRHEELHGRLAATDGAARAGSWRSTPAR